MKISDKQWRTADTVLIVGKGSCWCDDVEAFWALDVSHDVMALNEAAITYPCTPRHAYGYDSGTWRAMKPLLPHTMIHSCRHNRGVDYVWNVGRGHGSSAMFAVKVSLGPLGYSRAVLAGVPLDGDHHKIFRPAWREERENPIFTRHVRAMSGYISNLFGAPNAEWLNGEHDS